MLCLDPTFIRTFLFKKRTILNMSLKIARFMCFLRMFLYILIFFAISTYAYEIEDSPDEVFVQHFVNEVDDIKLPCWSHQLDSNGTFSWEKSVINDDDMYVVVDRVEGVNWQGCSNSSLQTRFEGKFSETSKYNYTYILFLPSTLKHRDGNYTCKYRTNVSSDHRVLKIYNVRVIKINDDNETIESVEYLVGGTADLICLDTCYEHHHKYFVAQWTYFPDRKYTPNDGLLNYTSNRMTFPIKTKNDGGIYHCSIKGLTYTKQFIVNVQSAPNVYMRPNTKELKNEKDGLKLECFVEACPMPSIKWTRNGVEISTSEYGFVNLSTPLRSSASRTITFAPMKDCFSKSILEISSMEDKDFGKYMCRASNIVGHSNNTITVVKRDNRKQPKAVN